MDELNKTTLFKKVLVDKGMEPFHSDEIQDWITEGKNHFCNALQ